MMMYVYPVNKSLRNLKDLKMFVGFQSNFKRNQTYGYDTYMKTNVQYPDSLISVDRKLPADGGPAADAPPQYLQVL